MVTKLLRSTYFYFFAIGCAALSSCSIFDTKEQIPSYIHIDKITFVPGDTAVTAEGTGSTKITDAWVYIDEQLVGAYELPATFPVQYSGVHSVRVLGGIKQNGISATRVKYPFYNSNLYTVDLTPKQTSTISPTVSYFSGITFSMVEDFEAAGYLLVDTMGDARLRVVTGAQAWGGGKSVYAQLAADTITLQARSANMYSMYNDGHAKFLELNYHCNHAFVFGLIYSGGTYPIVGLNASPNWNKVYINITDQITASIPSNYGFYFAMQKLLTDQGVPELYIDNVKLIHN